MDPGEYWARWYNCALSIHDHFSSELRRVRVHSSRKPKPLTAADALHILSERLPEMKRDFDVAELAIFGSLARDEARPDSDLDVLVVFAGPATFDNFMGLKLYPEELFGRSVNLGTKKSLREEVRPYVEPEMINVS